MATTRLLPFLAILCIPLASFAATKTFSIKASIGDDVLTTMLRERFSTPYVTTQSGNTLTLRFEDIYVDFENGSGVLYFKAKAEFTNAGLAYQKDMVVTKNLTASNLRYNTENNAIKILDLLAGQLADVPAWVRTSTDNAVSPILVVQEAKKILQRNQGKQLHEDYPIFATATFGLTVVFLDDKMDFTLSNNVVFDAFSHEMHGFPSPIRSSGNLSMSGQANAKFKLREVSIFDANGTAVRNYNLGGTWATREAGTAAQPWKCVVSVGATNLGADVYTQYIVGETSKTFFLSAVRIGVQQ